MTEGHGHLVLSPWLLLGGRHAVCMLSRHPSFTASSTSQAVLQLSILLPQLPEPWDYRNRPPCLTWWYYVSCGTIMLWRYSGIMSHLPLAVWVCPKHLQYKDSHRGRKWHHSCDTEGVRDDTVGSLTIFLLLVTEQKPLRLFWLIGKDAHKNDEKASPKSLRSAEQA